MVIGRGFNHYRPGFKGAMSDIAQQKNKQKHQYKSSAERELSCTYGGGQLANVEFSMHSEMMAIRSALSLSSHKPRVSARATAWYETPCFKLPGRGRREHKLRRMNVQQYAERVCEAAEKRGGKIESDALTLHGDGWRFKLGTCGLDQVLQRHPQRAYSEPEDGSEGEAEWEQEANSLFTSSRGWSGSVSVS